MYRLNIHLKSIRFNRSLISPNDKIRVSVTTIPEDNKAALVIDAKQMNNINNSLTVNITDKTKKIIFVLRKKSFFQNDPIIASTIIRASDFPDVSNSKNIGVKSIGIFEPIQNNTDSTSLANHHYSKDHRRLFGQMEIIFRIEHHFSTVRSYSHGPQISKITKRDSSLNNTENENLNDILFIDSGVTNL